MSMDSLYAEIALENRQNYMIDEYETFIDELYREPLRQPLILPVHFEQKDFGLSRTCGSAEKRHGRILTPGKPEYRHGTILCVQGIVVGHVKLDNYERSFLSWIDCNDGQEDVLVKGGLYELGHKWLQRCRKLDADWHVVDDKELAVSPRRPTRKRYGLAKLIDAECQRLQNHMNVEGILTP